MKTCPVCQKLVNDDTKFCYYCGASLLTPEPAAEEPAAEPEPVEIVPEPVEAPVAEAPVPEPEPEPVEAPEPVVIPAPEPEPVKAPEPEPVKAPEPEPVKAPEPEPVRTPEPVVIPTPVKEPEPVKAPEPEKTDVVVHATDSRSLMTTAGYIFSTILFHIPVIGIIFLFVWGCGRPKNISLKRYALAWLIMRLLCVVFLLSFAVFVLICYSDKFPILTDAFRRFFS